MVYLETHGLAVSTGLELSFERAYEVMDFLVVDLQIAVAGNTELVAATDLQATK